MRVIVSGTASSRLSRVQRTLSNVATFEANVLTNEAIDAAINDTVSNKEGTSASSGSSSSFKGSKEAYEHGCLGHHDPSALVLLSPQDLCACGLFSSDVIQVAPRIYHRCIASSCSLSGGPSILPKSCKQCHACKLSRKWSHQHHYQRAMQVSNATRPDVPAHLAIVQALHDTDDTTRPQDSTPPSAKALLTPFLAYNLGLEYHAAPFYTASSQQDKSATHTAQSLGVPAEQASCGAVRLSRWRGSSGDVASPAVLPVADAVWVSSVRQPDASLLQSQLGTEHIAAEAAAHDHPRRSDDQQQQKHGKTQADDGFDSALVAALQSYFKQHPR